MNGRETKELTILRAVLANVYEARKGLIEFYELSRGDKPPEDIDKVYALCGESTKVLLRMTAGYL
jgi:hypothetical protein